MITIFFVSFNYYNGYSFYIKKARRQITEYSNTYLAISSTILNNTRYGSSLIVYGKDWGSEIPYYSQRKSFMVPNSFSGFDKVWLEPKRYVGTLPIDAFVFFLNNKNITLTNVLSFPNRSGYNLFCLNPDLYIYIWKKKHISYQGKLLHSLN